MSLPLTKSNSWRPGNSGFTIGTNTLFSLSKLSFHDGDQDVIFVFQTQFSRWEQKRHFASATATANAQATQFSRWGQKPSLSLTNSNSYCPVRRLSCHHLLEDRNVSLVDQQRQLTPCGVSFKMETQFPQTQPGVVRTPTLKCGVHCMRNFTFVCVWNKSSVRS